MLKNWKTMATIVAIEVVAEPFIKSLLKLLSILLLFSPVRAMLTEADCNQI